MRQPARQRLLSGACRAAPAQRKRAGHGIGLFDAIIALAILSFGMLAMTRLQGRLLAQGSEAQQRLLATQLVDELLSHALVDVGNAACYTLPQAGACASAGAQTRANTWATRVAAALPGPAGATSTLAANRLTVAVTWTGKGDADARRQEATTDVRP
ncbi:MAG TPA: pilus assembly protein PilV [Rubrivivax sp.]|nr:pilus assembly protein PilV [Rubrivivax sp.]HPO20730.1 pilus assembly protein PilV [Rubrivivax sp.]